MRTDKLRKRNRIYKEIIEIILIIFLQAGCAPKISEEEIKKIENFDPQFKASFAKKKDIDLRILALKNKIALEKSETERRIEILREDFRNKKEGIEREILEIKKELEPEIKTIEEKRTKLNQEILSLQKRRSDIENMLKNTQNLIKKSEETNISIQDKADWERQIRILEKEKEVLDREISSFKEKVSLYGLELMILRQ